MELTYDLMQIVFFILFLFSEFQLSYLLPKSSCSKEREDIFLTLTSDWDLDVAFRTAANPNLFIRIDQNQGIALSLISTLRMPK